MSALPPLSEVEEAFAFFDQWEDRYRYIMDLGAALPAMSAEDRTDQNRVEGCQSEVWVVLQDAGGRISFHADSDSAIVKGLAAIVVIALEGRSAAEIVHFDLDALFERLTLHEHLRPTRSNGLHGMVRQVRSRAAALAASG